MLLRYFSVSFRLVDRILAAHVYGPKTGFKSAWTVFEELLNFSCSMYASLTKQDGLYIMLCHDKNKRTFWALLKAKTQSTKSDHIFCPPLLLVAKDRSLVKTLIRLGNIPPGLSEVSLACSKAQIVCLVTQQLDLFCSS